MRWSTAVLLAGLWLLAPAAAAAVEIAIWEFPRIPDPADPYDRFSWLRSLLARFESEHPGTKIQLTELSWQNGADKLKIAVYAGAPPDLTSGALAPKMAAQGALDPVDEFLTAADRVDYLPGCLEAFRYAGRTWGWPWCSVGDLLYVNLEIARERGARIPPDGRWSWTEFREAVRAMTGDGGPPGGRVYGFGFVSVMDRSADYGMLGLDGARPIPAPGEPGLDSPEALRSVERLLGLMRADRIAPENCGGMEDKDLWQAFSERRSVACAPFGLWALKALERKKPFPYAIAAFPAVGREPARSPTATSGYMVFRQTDPEKRRLCHELARFLTSGENQRLLASYGQFPTRRSAGEIYEKDPPMRLAQSLVSGGFPMPVHPAWSTIDARVKSALQLVFLGKADARQTLAELSVEARRSAEASPAAPAGALSSGASGLFGLLFFAAFVGAVVWLAAARGKDDRSAWGFLLPSMAVFALCTVWPVLRAVLLAFQEYQPGGGLFEGFCGLDNFRAALSSRDLWPAVRNTAVYTAVVVPAQIALGLGLASLLYPLASTARHFFRVAFYIPGVASVVVMAMVWRWLFDDSFGLANRLLSLGALAPLKSALAGWTPILANPGWLLASVYLLVFVCIAVRDLAGWTRLAGWLAAGGVLSAGLYLLSAGLGGDAGPGPVRWLTSTELSLFSIALSTILKGPGGALLIYLAAMEAIPPELFEAAKADGAGPLAQWWHVMLPLVRPTTLFLAVTGAIDSFQVFAQVLMLTDGGPAGSSTVLVHQIYTRAFRELEFGQASALALLLFCALAAISAVQWRFLSTDWEY